MKKLLALLLLVCSPVLAGSRDYVWRDYLVAEIPSGVCPKEGQVWTVSDGNDDADCSAGNGVFTVICACIDGTMQPVEIGPGIWTEGSGRVYPTTITNDVGIGTTTVPHGGVGWAKLAIEGTQASVDGPHIQLTTDQNDYPLVHLLGYQHDSVTLAFDAYYQSGWKSSLYATQAAVRKSSGKFGLYTQNDITAGNAITWNPGVVIDANYDVRVGIGTDSPSTELHLTDSVVGTVTSRVENTNNGTTSYVASEVKSTGGVGGLYATSTAFTGSFGWNGDALVLEANSQLSGGLQLKSYYDMYFDSDEGFEFDLDEDADGATDLFAIRNGADSTIFSVAETDGEVGFSTYGSGTHTGTTTYLLGVDASGNVTEETGGAFPGFTDLDTDYGTETVTSAWTIENLQLESVGIGTAPDAGVADVYGSITHTSDPTITGPDYSTMDLFTTFNFDSTLGGGYHGIETNVTAGASMITANATLRGLLSNAYTTGGAVEELIGGQFTSLPITGSSADSYGIFSYVGGALSTRGYGAMLQCVNAVTCYGLYINSSGSTSATDYGIYQDGIANTVNYLESDLGIGTSSPGNDLHIYDTQSTLMIESSTAVDTVLKLKNTVNEWRPYVAAGGNFNIRDNTAATTPFIIENAAPTDALCVSDVAAGRVGVNTCGPSHNLDVHGTSARLYDSAGSTNMYMRVQNADATNTYGAYYLAQSQGKSWYWGVNSAGNWILRDNSASDTMFVIGQGATAGTVFNESGSDRNFRFEGDTDTNLLFLDAGTDRVGIGTNAPATLLDVNGAATITGALSLGESVTLEKDNNANFTGSVAGVNKNFQFVGRSATGTIASPGATASGSILVGLSGRGHDGTSYDNNADYMMLTTEAWSGTANGTYHRWRGTETGTTTRSDMMTLKDFVLALTPITTAPATCTEGEIYADDGGSLCYCYTADTWEALNASGGGCT